MAQNQDSKNYIIGSWKGKLPVSGTKLPVIFHIKQDENTKSFSAH